MLTIPVDSTDAREQRELEDELAASYADEQRRHADECRGGWCGEDADGRPIVCLTCRPWLLHVPCRLCSVPYQACSQQQAARRGPCCEACNHARREAGPAWAPTERTA